ncbi:signal peptidase I [Ureibacillus sp. FSL K6-8385]|uniref:Signal peptidase I n=1 Tax=Ureibacillus terrenus TaxID=118246 RepID=A0A540V4D0_9BACL|nr:signal peptidase I [Ureibacillus terrenus]MED3660377.1 signal peptidase I [Ureibacillus terrenus]MED3762533.1 signal peptidase I [Ureibacillus terrenus]TQE91599.1 signal peptidase I [Ureibacillus terrenus]
MDKKKKEKNEVWEWTKALVIALLIAVVVRYFLFTPIVVDGESMMPTLKDGDKMIVNKIGYRFGEPKRFDIVVFHAPEGKDYIKRVIGLPGEHIEYKDDQLYINGEPVDEPYLDEYKSQLTEGQLTQDFTLQDIDPNMDVIPEGYVFVMGDNRRYSKDSRHIGVISEDDIIGKTSIVFWPLSEMKIVK